MVQIIILIVEKEVIGVITKKNSKSVKFSTLSKQVAKAKATMQADRLRKINKNIELREVGNIELIEEDSPKLAITLKELE